MENLQKSVNVMSAILSALLDRGFQQGMFGIGDIKIAEDESPFFAGTFKWLISEGIVRVGNTAESADSFDVVNPVLTSRGLYFLGQKLEIDGNTVTLSDVVREPGQVEGKMSAIGEFFGGFTMGAIKAGG